VLRVQGAGCRVYRIQIFPILSLPGLALLLLFRGGGRRVPMV